MEPKDLKNSKEELKATPEENGAAATPKKEKKSEKEAVEKESESVMEEKPEESQVVDQEDEPADESSEVKDTKQIAEEEETEVKPEARAEATGKPEEEAEVKPEAKAEATGKLEKETETKSEAKAEATGKPEEEAEVKPEAKAEATGKPEKETETKPEAKAEKTGKPEEETEVKSEAKTKVTDKPEKEVDSDSDESQKEVTTPVESKDREEAPVDKPKKDDSDTDEKTDEKESTDGDEDEKELSEEEASAVIARGKVDYSNLTEVELINALRDIVNKTGSEDIDVKEEVDRIKINFYKKHRANIEAEKKKFIEEGGDENEFKPDNAPYEEDLKSLLKEYRQIKNDKIKNQELEKDENLQIKYDIIEEIKSLVNRKESINKTFQEFRDLQQKWRDTGLVPQSKLKDLWETYHHHVENFYDYIKINKELRDLDLKKNMESKIGLCEKAEELLVEPSAIKAFNILQKYHEQWREIGPVPRDKKDELWERFKAATSKINKRQQQYFENRKEEQKKNLEAKTVLCEKAEEIAALELDSHKDWDEKSKELIELQKVWRTIGFAPKKDNNKIYDRFRSSCDKFFDAKREFYAQNKEMQQNNMQLKTDLCVQAESLKDSQDWKKTTDEFISIQRKWKEIGPVPRKHSDALWKRFRTACDFFFDQKSKHFSEVDHAQEENLKLKKDLIDEIKNYKLTKDEDTDLTKIKEFQRRWTEIGHVPYKEKDVVQNEFRDAINVHFDKLKIDDQKRNLLKFKTKMGSFSTTSRGQNKMRFERDKYIQKLKQLENDLVLLNNNIGFFANTKNAESLIDDVNKKIQNTQEKIEFLKEKIRIIDEMEDED